MLLLLPLLVVLFIHAYPTSSPVVTYSTCGPVLTYSTCYPVHMYVLNNGPVLTYSTWVLFLHNLLVVLFIDTYLTSGPVFT